MGRSFTTYSASSGAANQITHLPGSYSALASTIYCTHQVACSSRQGGVAARWPALADAADELLTGDAVCVLDDYHLIDGSAAAGALARFIDRVPAHLHLLITSQVRPTLPGLSRWHAHGWVTTIDRGDLTFRVARCATTTGTATGCR